MTTHPLRNISEIRSFYRTNDEPIYFVGPTPFNLLGLDRWVRNFNYLTYYDPWDGQHPRIITPSQPYDGTFTSSEQITNWLLRNPELQARLKARGGKPRVMAVFIDEETEEICRELGYTLTLPPVALRKRLDSKLETTRLGNEAGAPSVPNILASADSYDELLALAGEAGLGSDLVIQLPYGDSGKTTFFVASQQDWDKYAEELAGQEAKIMKRIRNTAFAVEGCITRHGTIVGPFMVDLTGYESMTPYKGGWCGNDVFPETMTQKQRTAATQLVRKLGDRLALEGYTGFFEVDTLIDLDTDEVYLGELNPRISGASPITMVTAGAYADLPLYLFHLLEYMDVDYTIDTDEINERWTELAAIDQWSQLIMKQPEDEVSSILAAPRTGTWAIQPDGSFEYRRPALDWHGLQDENEFFFMRIYGPGDYLFKGADLGIVMGRSRMQTDDPKSLTPRCEQIVSGIRSQYVSSPLTEAPVIMPTLLNSKAL
ncbi:MAG TPA: biotin carboxylase [Tetrasphaera sp.]|uniref:biotin carboxylase n=1 Tax=Nostocoides sp. TaxID=1917966 RepID=UPI002BE2FA60|nr:biotin carboxylase [Tetrasphaera sp.]HNQ07156.1 biotin carboxylase [Tetrasphaera sp.]